LKSEKYKILPITKKENIKKQEWSYIYAFNIRTLRDIFAYCALNGQINEKKLYKDMEEYKIPPPKEHWVNKRRKREGRLRLEYIHAAEYLDLIKRENGKVYPNYDELKKEKIILKNENRNRSFNRFEPSPPLTKKEKKALIKIILNYERARDYLRWFLDFSKYYDIFSFSYKDFIKDAKPIFILGKIEKDKKGSEILKRSVDNTIWQIPKEYIRLASGVFPSWFSELGVIDKIVIFPEFSEDKELWHMFYPIKMDKNEFLKLNITTVLMKTFLNAHNNEKIIWIPYLFYVLAQKYSVSVDAIKTYIKKIHEADPSYFYLERIPAHLMKSRLRYKESYIEIDGFFRSHLKLTKR